MSPEEVEVKAPEFKEKLRKLEFDEDTVRKDFQDKITSGKGFSLIRGEIVGKEDASGETITKEMVDRYIEKNGGRRFLERIYRVGVRRLEKDFRSKKKRRFKRYIRLLQGTGRRADNFRESRVGKRILELSKKLGVSLDQLTFEQAFDSGLFRMQPTLERAAAYGLTWWEYRRRIKRLRIIRRKERKAETAGIGADLLAEEPKVAEEPKIRTERPDTYMDALKGEMPAIRQRKEVKVESVANGYRILDSKTGKLITVITILPTETGIEFNVGGTKYSKANAAAKEAGKRIDRYVAKMKEEAEETEEERLAKEAEVKRAWKRELSEFLTTSFSGAIARQLEGQVKLAEAGKPLVIKCDFSLTRNGKIFYLKMNPRTKKIIARSIIRLKDGTVQEWARGINVDLETEEGKRNIVTALNNLPASLRRKEEQLAKAEGTTE